MPKGIKLSDKEKAYIYWRARNYNLVDSVIKAGYKTKSRIVASVYGNELDNKPKISEAIELEKLNIFDSKCITKEFILEGLHCIAMNGQIEANRLRAYELLGKALPESMFTDKVKQEGGQTQIIIAKSNTQSVDNSKDIDTNRQNEVVSKSEHNINKEVI